MQFSIPVDTIKALLLAAAKGDIRYYLNAVCLDVAPDGSAVAVSTNGHIMLALPVERAEDDGEPRATVAGQYVIPRDVLEGLKAPWKGGAATVTIDTAAQTVTVAVAGKASSSALVDGKFPEWRRVVPRKVSGLASQFNAEYVATFGKIHKLLGGKFSPGILHNGGDGGNFVESAARVLLPGEAVGVLMPMRGYDGATVENPAWLDYPAATDTAAAA
jgi:DNA polymerase-3 subunit beta